MAYRLVECEWCFNRYSVVSWDGAVCQSCGGVCWEVADVSDEREEISEEIKSPE